MEIKQISAATDKSGFYAVMGEFFASGKIRRTLGYPLENKPVYIWLVVMDDTVKGFVNLDPEGLNLPDKKVTLDDLYGDLDVLPVLLAEGLALAQRKGALAVTAKAYNQEIANFYVEQGFDLVNTRGRYQEMRKEIPHEG